MDTAVPNPTTVALPGGLGCVVPKRTGAETDHETTSRRIFWEGGDLDIVGDEHETTSRRIFWEGGDLDIVGDELKPRWRFVPVSDHLSSELRQGPSVPDSDDT